MTAYLNLNLNLNLNLKPGEVPASRKDLLGVCTVTRAIGVSPQWVRSRLRALGFRIRKAAPGHWLVTREDSPLMLHFYSHQELARFAIHRAERYSHRTCNGEVP